MRKTLKAIAALISFLVVYFLASVLIFLLVVYLNGGSFSAPMNWRAYAIGAFASAWAGYLGFGAGYILLARFFEPYPRRFVGISFIALLGLWFVPLTLIYLAGGAFILAGEDLGDWPPEGEFGEYLLGLVRAIVAVICTWAMLVKRHAKDQMTVTAAIKSDPIEARVTRSAKFQRTVEEKTKRAKVSPQASQISPEVEAIFRKLDRQLNDEKAQNDWLPEPFRSKVIGGLDCDQLFGSTGEFGRVPQNPIPVNGPLGELLYLSSLRSEAGQGILFHRLTSIGDLDLFETATFDGTKWDVLFLDPYHPRKSRLAPTGYSIAPERGAVFSGTNMRVVRFPEDLPEAISATTKQFLGISIAGKGVREALQQREFERPSAHGRMVELVLSKIAEWERSAVKN